MNVWVTRRKDLFSEEIEIFKGNKPTLDLGFYLGVYGSTLIAKIPILYFKYLFGFTPRKGSCKQYDLILEEVK